MAREVTLVDPSGYNAHLVVNFYQKSFNRSAKIVVQGTTGIQGFSPHQVAQLILHASQWLLSLPPEDTDP